jgi:putative aldouronate transport system substrate-binding protein
LGGGDFGSWAGDRWSKYEIVPPLNGPQGVQTTSYFNTAVNGTMAITKAAKHPEVAIRWVDWLFTTEGALRLRIGRKGYEWDDGGPGDMGLNGKQAVWKKLTPIGTVQNFFWGVANFPQTFDHSTQARAGIEGPLYDAAMVYRKYTPKEYLLPIWVGVEDIQEYVQLRTEINDYVAESTARFITGDLSLDSAWAEYLKNLEGMGLKRYLELLNKWYKAKYGTK